MKILDTLVSNYYSETNEEDKYLYGVLIATLTMEVNNV